VNELRTLKYQFRSFYQEIVDLFLKDMKRIGEFANKMKSSRKTFSKTINKTFKKRGG
jgi:predicted DNA-binding protein (UPF0251 family)